MFPPLRACPVLPPGAVLRGVKAAMAEVRLPMSTAAWSALARSCRELSGAVRVLVVRFEPAGPSEVTRPSTSSSPPPDVESSLDALARLDLVSVAVVDAELGGPALAIALACDLRVWSVDGGVRASAEAMGCLGRLADLVGYSRAVELCLTGRQLHAAEAVSLGLATVAVAPEQVDAAIDDLVCAVIATPRHEAIELKATLSSSDLDSAARARRVRAELAAAARLAGEHE
ncbi:MAG: enoyl-CoA hydratase/isomerase family protein [Acidothermaceae bacterium]